MIKRENAANKISGKNKLIVFYGVIFVLLFFLCLLFPYTGDDWAWGSQIGLERLNEWFDNYSGRYFGNLIVLALTRSNLLKAFTMSFCLTGIIVILNKLTGEQKNGVFIISSVLVFMPVTLLRQAIVWTSGFANYTTSIFLTLIYIYYVNHIYSEDKPKNSWLAVLPLAVLGFANTLIVEHLTLYNVLLALYVIVFTLIKFKKLYIQYVAYFAGTVAGTALMFSNSVYHSVSEGDDSYRTMGKIIDFATIIEEGFINNCVLNIFLIGVCTVIYFMLKNKFTKKSKRFGAIAISVMIAFAASSLLLKLSGVKPLEILTIVVCIATVIYIIAFMVFLFALPLDMEKKLKLFFIFGSVGCMIAPLFVVTPIGSRCFFAPYVMMLYLGMEFYTLFDESLKKRCDRISKVTIIAALVGLVYLFCIYGTIFVCNNKRVEKAQLDARSGLETIQIEELPYKDYVWCADLEKKVWQERFKLFYDIEETVKIEQIKSAQRW